MPRKAATSTKAKPRAKAQARSPTAPPRRRESLAASVSAAQIVRRHLQASYDAAQTTDRNSNHWSYADSLSADAAHTSSVRKTLRSRARYEAANNSYCKGIVLTLANDTIGTGPRLQMLLGDKARNQQIERDWSEWAQAVGLAAKLRTARQAKAVDGEVFLLPVNAPRLETDVKLGLRLVEADQVSTPDLWMETDYQVDGIKLDENGDPLEYHLLKYHPGGLSAIYSAEYTRIPARDMLHWFRVDRPWQHRGVPEITPALPLFAQLRRFTLATIQAAETSANIALAIHTSNPPDDESIAPSPMDTLELERGYATVLPDGYQLSQVEQKHPATTYEMFKRAILNEIARCLNVPYNVAACDSSDYNYASGRLDYQVYFKSINVERDTIEGTILERVFRLWLQEYAALRSGIRPSDIALTLRDYPHQWYWDGREHVDPVKEASALDIRLKNGTDSIPADYARRGLDWEAEQQKAAESLGMTVEEYRAGLRLAFFAKNAGKAPQSQEAA